MNTTDPEYRHITPSDASPKWARLRDALLDLARVGEMDPDRAMAHLLATSAEALGVARVSFWRWLRDGQVLERELIHIRGGGRDDTVVTLKAAQAPLYFDALSKTLTLAAEDVRLDDRTQELLESYLLPLGIGAMLDVSVRSSGELIGVVCHEHVGPPRAWNAEERMFAAAIAALTAQQIEHGRRIQAELEQRRALLTDPLTGLPNRTSLLDTLGRRLGQRDPDLGALLIADLDRFHRINHAFGAEIGDQVLTRIAQRLRALYPTDRLARLGNDQFAIIGFQPPAGADGREHSRAEAMRLRQALHAPLGLAERRLDLTVSVGVLDDLAKYDRADEALRDAMIVVDTASRGPRGNIALFDASMRGRVRDRLRLEQDIRRAVREGEFEFHLQPILRVADKALMGAEALLRWWHPERGLLLPAKFIEVAEEVGLLQLIHAAALPPLLTEASAWRHRQGLAEFRVGVNLAACQLAHPDIAGTIGQTCDRAGLPASALWLEVTENTLLEAGSGVEAGLQNLCVLGASLALDDFGTGHASLTHLIRLPLASVKIDQSFVSQLGEHQRAEEIVRGMIGMAHALGLRVVAEGVENQVQFDLLKQMNCDQVQGFVLGHPLSPADFEAHWIAAETGSEDRQAGLDKA